MENKEKKNLFDEEIDNKISGFALGFAFLSIGGFLLIYPNYLGNKFASNLIRWIFIITGILGLSVEFSKRKSENIKGVDNLIMGAALIGIWVTLFLYATKLWIKILSFFLLLIALYGLYRGLIEIIYSIYKTRKNQKGTKQGLITDVMLLLTRFFSLILVIVQIIKALGT